MNYKKILIAAIFAATSTLTFAQNAILSNEYVKAGVNATTGTLGSGGNTNPGIQYDSTGTGTFNSSYDYLTPGSPFEGFTIKIDGTMYRNNNAGNFRQITGNWVGSTSSSSAVWAGSVTGVFDLQNTYSLPSGQQYLGIQTRITVTNAVSDLYFARYIDPDARAAAGDSSATDNVRGYSGIPGTNVVFSEALTSRYALGLYTSQLSNTNTGPSNSWSTDPSVYYTGGSYTVGQGDHTIGLVFYSSGLNAGDIVTYNYAYIFGPNAFTAATTATTAYDPSATFTVTDVGSATSGASGPTETGRSTSTITVSDTTVRNNSLPIITAAVAHHTASETDQMQTIARETTTTTTTPMTRTLVTLDRTVVNFSDGTSTTSDSATTTTTTNLNSVSSSVANDSFSGRVDQMSVLNNVNLSINRALNMNAFRNDGVQSEKGIIYINGYNSKTSAANGYKANGEQFGISPAVDINKDLRVGLQLNRVQTNLDGVDSNTKQNKNHLGLFSIYRNEDVVLETNLGYAQNQIYNNRSIAGLDFTNSYNTKGTDTWLTNKVYAPSTNGFRPFVGVTVGRSTTNEYSESGSIQSARSVAKNINDYNFGEIGLRYNTNIDKLAIGGELSASTDDVKTAGIRLAYAVNKNSQLGVEAIKQVSATQTTDAVRLTGVVRF